MRFLMVLLPFLIPFAVHAQSGVSTSYIRMTPTTLPSKCRLGDLRVDTSSDALQLCSPANTWAPFTTTASGVAISIGNLDGYSPSSQGQSLNSNILYAQSASSSNPGLVNTTSQTFAGQKNFPTPPSIGIGTLSPSLPLLLDGSNNVTSGKVSLATQTTGSLGVANGGTGQSSLTAHSVIVGNGTSGVTQVGPGTSNYVLAGAGASADPSFATISSILDSIGSAQGDLLYRGSSGWSVLAPGTGGYVLSTNGAGANPSWISVSGVGTVTSVGLSVPAFLSVANSPVTGAGTLTVNFSGTAIPVANGGTGLTSTTSYGVLIGGTTSTGAFQNAGAGTAGQVLTSAGSASAPTWAAPVTNSYFNGHLDLSTTNNWSTTSSTYAALTSTGGTSSLTTRNSNGLTITAAASNALGVTFTPSSSTAVYLVHCMFQIQNSLGANAGVRLYDGTNVISNLALGFQPSSTAGSQTAVLFGFYAPGTSSAVTISVQAFTSNGTLSLAFPNGDAAGWTASEWEIMQIK